MLEEALASDTFSPAEAALALLSYVRYELPAGGANAEARFFRLFSLLCDRLFGRMAGPKEQFRHEVGGWLSRQNKWNRHPSSSSTSPRPSGVKPSSSSQSIDADPVVQLLAGIEALVPQKDQPTLPTLIEAISTEADARPTVRFPFPLEALPKPTQDVMLALFQEATTRRPPEGPLRDNAARLVGSLLRVRPHEQRDLQTVQLKKGLATHEQKQPLSLSPRLTMASPAVSTTSTPSKEQSEVPAKIMLSMQEIYLVTFIRFPLASPKPPPTQSQSSSTSNRSMVNAGVIHQHRRPTMPYGEQVYLHLFRGYLKHYLPFEAARGPFIGFDKMTRESELFLRVAIEFWFEGNLKIPTTSEAIQAIEKRRSRTSAGGSSLEMSLAMSFDMIDVKYEPPPTQVQRCLRSLVNHIVKHPDIPRASADISEVTKSLATSGASSSQNDHWCLSPCMSVLQQPFYNYIRTTFRHASVHVGSAPFQTAFDSWLIWLEPWNIEMRKKNVTLANATNILTHSVSANPQKSQTPQTTQVIVVPKPTSRSKYSKKFEPYIAANLHLYTVPLAIFLRRARELDFSPKEFRRSLTLVQRVFRVLSPEVVQTINALLSSDAHPLSSAVERHERALGAYSPSAPGKLDLSSCKDDMHNLLEEIYSAHMKAMRELDWLDRIGAYLGLGDVTSSEEKELKALVAKAKVIVNFPADYVVIPSESRQTALTSTIDKDERCPERQPHGFLTERGVEQLVNGSVRCTALDVVTVGDQLHSRVKSYEIAQLVPWTIKASEWLNQQLGLVVVDDDGVAPGGEMSKLDELEKESRESQKLWFRFNLRFLADYRTILWICVISWLYRFFRQG